MKKKNHSIISNTTKVLENNCYKFTSEETNQIILNISSKIKDEILINKQKMIKSLELADKFYIAQN
jgi:hypothetical protein